MCLGIVDLEPDSKLTVLGAALRGGQGGIVRGCVAVADGCDHVFDPIERGEVHPSFRYLLCCRIWLLILGVRDEVFKSPPLLFSRWFVQHRYRLLAMGDCVPAFLAPAKERGRVLEFKERGRLGGTGGVGT